MSKRKEVKEPSERISELLEELEYDRSPHSEIEKMRCVKDAIIMYLDEMYKG